MNHPNQFQGQVPQSHFAAGSQALPNSRAPNQHFAPEFPLAPSPHAKQPFAQQQNQQNQQNQHQNLFTQQQGLFAAASTQGTDQDSVAEVQTELNRMTTS